MSTTKISTREAYGNALAEFGDNKNIIVLDADLSKSTKTEIFKKKFPERFINIGIAESNMMSIAAGLAACGKTVFASTFAIFAAGRAFEQVRNSICYSNLNVKIGASHAGITVGEDGASHQAIEDIALMCAIPNMVVISPSDGVETRHAVKAAIDHNGPIYLRFSRLAMPLLFDENNYKFEIGKGIIMKDGGDVTIVATGLMLHIALFAVAKLESQNIHAKLINMHTIKPIDKDIIVKAAKETGAIVTVEEHNVIGGLGSMVSSVVCQNHPVPIKMVGIQDLFGKSGKPDKLMERYGLTEENIIKQVKEVLKLKR